MEENEADMEQARTQTHMVTSVKRARREWTHKLTQVAVHVVISLLAILFLVPYLWMISTSLKIDPQVYHVPPVWIPNPIRWLNYPEGLTYVPFDRYFLNTLKYGVFCTLGAVVSSALCAYGFSRVRWRGRDALFMVVLATTMLPFQVRMIPLYLVFKRLGWLNTYLPLIAPAYTGVPYFIFLLRQFFMTIPLDLSDAARMDGANDLDILLRIILPLSKPALAVVALFEFMYDWNDYLGPLIYLKDSDKYPIAMGLEQMRAHMQSMGTFIPQQWPRLMAVSTVAILPVVLLFFFAQRTFVEGITLTGVKG
jgi:ABC-type glycerol-3-phosphate transport system permease component